MGRIKVDESDGDAFRALMKKASEHSMTESTKNCTPEERIDLLRKRLADLQNKHNFKPGDLITWKEGMRFKKFPEEGYPAIVIEVLDEPIMDTHSEPSGPYYREMFDIIFGICDDDGDFVTYYGGSRCYRPWEEYVQEKKERGSN